MKIVNREAFLALPRGTVYVKVDGCAIDPPMIKLDSQADDFVYRDMIEVQSESSTEYVDMMVEIHDGTRDVLPLDWHPDMNRDGLFDQDQLFGVLDTQELTDLIDILTKARDAII